VSQKKKKPESPLAEAVVKLEEEVEQLELLSRRASKVELVGQDEIVRAAELLKRSLDTHGRFVAYLTELTKGISAIRDRQNGAVEVLQHVSSKLEERRHAWTALEQRFGHLGTTAQDINAMIRAGGDEDGEAAKKRVGVAVDRLVAAAAEARVLMVDAREAGFAELEQQADAMQQQLASLATKLEEARRGGV
jgi:DNA repair exonuclease SbcCD ATPase subunit